MVPLVLVMGRFRDVGEELVVDLEDGLLLVASVLLVDEVEEAPGLRELLALDRVGGGAVPAEGLGGGDEAGARDLKAAWAHYHAGGRHRRPSARAGGGSSASSSSLPLQRPPCTNSERGVFAVQGWSQWSVPAKTGSKE